MLRASLILSAVLLAAGCPKNSAPEPGPTPPADSAADAPVDDTALPDDPEPAAEPPAEGDAKPDGSECVDAGDCLSGICEGIGCGDDPPGKCAAKERMCTRDFRQYCGCDGKTFGGSGSCPGKRYASEGSCPGDPGPLDK
jgi:hypothetical protein